MEYHVRPLGKACATTGKELPPGSRCHSVLVEGDGAFTRLDFSEEGWKGVPDGAVGHWISTVPLPAAAKPKMLDAASLLRCFEQLCEEASPARDKFRYVLALMLLQKRKVQILGTREEDGVSYLELAGMQGEGPWEIRDRQVDDSEIEQLQQELNVWLAQEWEA